MTRNETRQATAFTTLSPPANGLSELSNPGENVARLGVRRPARSFPTRAVRLPRLFMRAGPFAITRQSAQRGSDGDVAAASRSKASFSATRELSDQVVTRSERESGGRLIGIVR